MSVFCKQRINFTFSLDHPDYQEIFLNVYSFASQAYFIIVCTSVILLFFLCLTSCKILLLYIGEFTIVRLSIFSKIRGQFSSRIFMYTPLFDYRLGNFQILRAILFIFLLELTSKMEGEESSSDSYQNWNHIYNDGINIK